MRANAKGLHGTRMNVMLHIAAWVFLLGLPLYNISRWDVPRNFIRFYYLNTLLYGFLFYVNYLVLAPRLFFNSIRIKYYVSVVVLAIGVFIISDNVNKSFFKDMPKRDKPEQIQPRANDVPAMENHDPAGNIAKEMPPRKDRAIHRPFGPPFHVYNYIFTAIVITVFALGLRVLERHSEIEKKQKELEKEMLNSELAFLKNQISPHFFFNTLNNIYSLISINTEDSQKAVLTLSRMMRYLLYDSEKGETKLSSEINFMNNYIDLMKLRMSDKVKLSVSFPEVYEDVSLPPLLFISLIENAFKHGISYREKSFIDIGMEVSPEAITFKCNNSVVKPVDEQPNNNSGIGLENLKKRLKLLFPNRHLIEIGCTESVFRILVKLYIAKT
jgi:two-component system, LytTR family, sensor kinase